MVGIFCTDHVSSAGQCTPDKLVSHLNYDPRDNANPHHLQPMYIVMDVEHRSLQSSLLAAECTHISYHDVDPPISRRFPREEGVSSRVARDRGRVVQSV